MKFHIKGKNIELTEEIKTFVIEKIGELEKFITADPDTVEAWVEVGKTTNHHQNGEVFEAKVDIGIPGHTFRAVATLEDTNSAVIEVRDQLQREIRQYKEKSIAKERKGMRLFKKIRNMVSPK